MTKLFSKETIIASLRVGWLVDQGKIYRILPAGHKRQTRPDTLVACGWAGAVTEKATGAFGQKQ